MKLLIAIVFVIAVHARRNLFGMSPEQKAAYCRQYPSSPQCSQSSTEARLASVLLKLLEPEEQVSGWCYRPAGEMCKTDQPADTCMCTDTSNDVHTAVNNGVRDYATNGGRGGERSADLRRQREFQRMYGNEAEVAGKFCYEPQGEICLCSKAINGYCRNTSLDVHEAVGKVTFHKSKFIGTERGITGLWDHMSGARRQAFRDQAEFERNYRMASATALEAAAEEGYDVSRDFETGCTGTWANGCYGRRK